MNKTMAIGLTSLLLTTLNLSPAQAFFHGGGGSWSASGFRGTASGGDGSWSASGYRGGSASGSDGSWSGTGFRGSTASGGDGSWSASGYRGGSASGGDGSWSGTGFRGGGQHPAVMVPGVQRVPMEPQPTAVMTTITAEPITGAIIRQRSSIPIQRVVTTVGVGMPPGPRPQER
ncbi:MAG: hypothetical protein ACKOX2_18630 [Microcystaceae cyanobacterium]